ncbi:UNVERIFIED_CONTAM: hypothetical protein FKN15_038711 [Acipenser sinensis]
MFRNRWISNYVGARKYCGDGFESEPSFRFGNSRLLQRRALRKERIARRLEAIESDTQLQSCAGLVSHRLLEEDTPRYTRANDPCSPCAARRFSKEELDIQESQDPSSERQSRARCRAAPQSIHTELTYSPGSMETAGTDSKAERIARYKAERRRQLAERYGISLDHELESDFSPKYPRMRKGPEALEQHAQASQNRKEQQQEDEDRELSSLYSTRTGLVREPKIMQSKENAFRDSVDCFSDRERMMNLENYKRAQDPGAQPGVYGQLSFTDVSTTAAVLGKDFSTGEVPSSPRHGCRSSLQSPQQAISPGDLFIEHQAQNILSRQGKERIARRLEAIESDTQLQSCAGLVSHRLLEEDTPRYTRANDPCSPCAARRFSKEELDIQESQDPSSERQSRARCRAAPQSIHTELTYSPGSMETAGTDSKAERIARYKAERRRQLAERYGISLDHELESDFSPKYPRMRKGPEALDQHAQASQNRKEQQQEEEDRELSSLYSTRTGLVREPKIMQSKENAFRDSVDCFSDRERMMNLENYKRAQDPGAQPGVYGQLSFTDVSTTAAVLGKDFSTGEVPSSPRHGCRSSLQSPQQAISPGDLFIEHQAQNILSRQG